MGKPARIKLEGREYIIVGRNEYERLLRLARVAEAPGSSLGGGRDTLPAVAYARASIARDVVRERVRVGLTQRELAARAGVRVETLCRIETGRHTASTATISKLEHALKQALRRKRTLERGVKPARRLPSR